MKTPTQAATQSKPFECNSYECRMMGGFRCTLCGIGDHAWYCADHIDKEKALCVPGPGLRSMKHS